GARVRWVPQKETAAWLTAPRPPTPIPRRRSRPPRRRRAAAGDAAWREPRPELPHRPSPPSPRPIPPRPPCAAPPFPSSRRRCRSRPRSSGAPGGVPPDRRQVPRRHPPSPNRSRAPRPTRQPPEPDAPVDEDAARAHDSESQRTVAPAQEGAQTQHATTEDAEHEQGSDLDAVPSPVVEDLRALADARGGAEPQPDEQDQARREQVQMDFASLLFQAPAPAQPRTTVGAGDAPVGSSELAFEAGGLTEDDQATEEESS